MNDGRDGRIFRHNLDSYNDVMLTVQYHWRKCRAVVTPSFLPHERAFEDYICSSLPYTEVLSEETFYTAVVLISGSRLVLSEVSEPSASFPMLTML